MPARSSTLIAWCCIALVAAPAGAWARCVDDGAVEPLPAMALAPVQQRAEASRLNLQHLVDQAVRRSQAVGASKLLADAAADDLDETRAGALPQAGLSGSVAALGSSGQDLVSSHGTQGRAALTLSAPLFDGGRTAELTGWRKALADAARQGQINAQEEIGLQTVSLALERDRQRLQAQVYRQYAEQMACLVDALEQIVSVDKGRASELLQARKNLQQVDLTQAQTASTLRQVETRLRRFVGDALPEADTTPTALLDVPPLATLLAEAGRAGEIAQLDAQAVAQDSYARAVRAGHRPQVSWVLSGGRALGVGNSTSYSAGLNINIPLYSPADGASESAALRRAEAARAQRDEALDARRFRIADAHEQATAALDRARRVVEVLASSNQVRKATLQQWQQLGRRSLFDVMAAEGDHYGLRVAYVNAVVDAQQSSALLRSLGAGLQAWLQ